jgi:IS4 transposase
LRKLYLGDGLGVELENTVSPAPFRTTKAAVKIHTLLDLRGNIPTFIHISDSKVHDVDVLDVLVPEAGAIYVMDRGYLDFERLHAMHQASAFFITRAKSNTRLHRVYSATVDRDTGIIRDQTVGLVSYYSIRAYPAHLRRIHFKDPESGKTLVFLTNNFALPAATICKLYKARWQVELFFKWILDASLYTLLQILSLTLFEKMPFQQAFAGSEPIQKHPENTNQTESIRFLTGH